jgi:Reverse transcriptase (RNA-dependent DNA polymerase)
MPTKMIYCLLHMNIIPCNILILEKIIRLSIICPGLPQGSTLSPFSYSFDTSEVDLCLPRNCSLIQYADDLAVYCSDAHSECIERCIQTACYRLNGFYEDIGLTISERKSELVLFQENSHTRIPNICILINGKPLPLSQSFRYLGVIFDRKFDLEQPC